MDTSIRVKSETYTTLVRARGAFEQTFGRRLTIDETVYLSAHYVNIAYEECQKLERLHLLKIITERDGSLHIEWSDLGKIVTDVLPRLMKAYENLKKMLSKKESIEIVSGQVS